MHILRLDLSGITICMNFVTKNMKRRNLLGKEICFSCNSCRGEQRFCVVQLLLGDVCGGGRDGLRLTCENLGALRYYRLSILEVVMKLPSNEADKR